MKISYTNAELKKYYNNESIIRDTALQVIKDFALFGIQIDFPNEIKYAYQELYVQLNDQINSLLVSNNMKIMSLLYQIDIPEKIIQQRSIEKPDEPLTDIVTELILERELKKVLTRHYFKEHGL